MEAKKISEAHKERKSPFFFSMCNIAVGEEIEFCYNGCEKSGAVCIVADDKHVKYNGEIYTLSALAQMLSGKTPLQGPKFFKYKGELLVDIRRRLGK